MPNTVFNRRFIDRLLMLSLLGNKPYRALNQLDDDGYALAYRCL